MTLAGVSTIPEAPAALEDAPRPIASTLQIIYSFKRGGAETVLLDLANGLCATSHYRPTVVAWREGGPLEAAFGASGADVHVLSRQVRGFRLGPLAALDAWRLVRDIAAIGRAADVRLVHGHMSDGGFLAALVARRQRRPCVVSVYSNHLLPLSIRRGSLRWWVWMTLAAWTFRVADRVIVLSDEIRDSLTARFPVHPEKIRVCPPGVAPVRSRESRAAAREKLGVGADDLVVLFVGRLVENKNQEALIETTRRLLDRGRPATLLLAGDGPDRDRLRSKTAHLGLEARVRILGLYDDLPRLFAAADVFVSASRTEGVSLAVIEAMSAGTPIIATANEGNRNTLSEGCGVLVDSDDPEKLADAVETVMADRGAGDEVIRRARARFESRYDVRRSVESLEAIYDGILSEGART